MALGTNAGKNRVVIGIEGGGTHTVALCADTKGGLIGRYEAGPANVRLLSDAELSQRLKEIASALPGPQAVAIGMAGARAEADRQRIRKAAEAAWPGVRFYITNDLETALMAAPSSIPPKPRVLVLSGTGSCCFGRTPDGKTVKVGGWGHILGDKGSGYEIGLRAMKAVVYYYDRDGIWPGLGERVLRALQLNEPDELIAWAQQAGKTDVASLAKEVFAAAEQRDKVALDILEGAAASLAKDAVACARRLAKPNGAVEFVFSGGILVKQPAFASKVSKLIRDQWPKAQFQPLARESAWGAVELALQLPVAEVEAKPIKAVSPRPSEELAIMPLKSLLQSPTEQRNPRSMKLDSMPLQKAIALMLDEDAKIPAAILGHRKGIEEVVRWIVQAFKKGGHLFYIRAGTSGRLGVLDASECPPTFRTPPELVQGIIAGGQRALWEAVEGAEDDPKAGARAVEFRGIRKGDVLVGIAASGRTPFVWGALQEARKRGAKTVLLTFNPNLNVPRANKPDLVLAINVGPEILTGSTRLKSGTATKLVLNIFTTLAMVHTGKVLSNLMVDVKASNVKLKDRATRIVVEITKADYDHARSVLEKVDWDIKRACQRLRKRR